jgi:type II secretory pathway component PulL
MKKTIYTLLLLLISLPIAAQLSQQSKNITDTFFPDISSVENVTPALKKKKGYTNYKELWGFLNDFKTAH